MIARGLCPKIVLAQRWPKILNPWSFRVERLFEPNAIFSYSTVHDSRLGKERPAKGGAMRAAGGLSMPVVSRRFEIALAAGKQGAPRWSVLPLAPRDETLNRLESGSLARRDCIWQEPGLDAMHLFLISQSPAIRGRFSE